MEQWSNVAVINKLKQLREETAISLAECKNALEQSGGDLNKAKQILQKKGLEIVEKKQQREVGAGIVYAYIHNNNKVGVLLDLRSETDFVAKNEKFQELAKEIAMQIAAMNPENKKMLLSQPWIKDESKKIEDLISEYIAKLGENIMIEKFVRYEI